MLELLDGLAWLTAWPLDLCRSPRTWSARTSCACAGLRNADLTHAGTAQLHHATRAKFRVPTSLKSVACGWPLVVSTKCTNQSSCTVDGEGRDALAALQRPVAVRFCKPIVHIVVIVLFVCAGFCGRRAPAMQDCRVFEALRLTPKPNPKL